MVPILPCVAMGFIFAGLAAWVDDRDVEACVLSGLALAIIIIDGWRERIW